MVSRLEEGQVNPARDHTHLLLIGIVEALQCSSFMSGGDYDLVYAGGNPALGDAAQLGLCFTNARPALDLRQGMESGDA